MTNHDFQRFQFEVEEPVTVIYRKIHHSHIDDRNIRSSDIMRLFGLVEDVSQMALATVLAVVHGSHEDTGTALDGEISNCFE